MTDAPRKAWCPTCRLVDSVDEAWRCIWCGTVTLTSLNRHDARESNLFTVSQLHAMHARYACGESLNVLAAEQHTGRDTLRQNFWHAGLPTRTLQATNILVAPRRRKFGLHRGANPAFRDDLADEAIVEVYARTRSMRATAREVGCSQSSVCRRLKVIRTHLADRGLA